MQWHGWKLLLRLAAESQLVSEQSKASSLYLSDEWRLVARLLVSLGLPGSRLARLLQMPKITTASAFGRPSCSASVTFVSVVCVRVSFPLFGWVLQPMMGSRRKRHQAAELSALDSLRPPSAPLLPGHLTPHIKLSPIACMLGTGKLTLFL